MVEIDGLYKRYGAKTALAGVHLRVRPGTVTGVLGENGSGKSTLFRIVAGVTHASGGQVRVGGQPVGAATRRITAYLPEVSPFYSWMRIDEQLAFLAAFYPGWVDAKARELLEFMKLTGDLRIGDLSQGQRARLKIVAAFSWASRLVVMDEPFNGIDPPSRRRILDALLREIRLQEQTVLISTHLVDEVEGLVEDVAYLRDGEIALQGTADELRAEKGGSLSDIFEEVVA